MSGHSMSGRASATVGPAEEDSGPDSPSRKGAWAAGSGTSGTSGEHSAGRKSPDTAGSAGSAAGHDKGGGLLGSIAHVPETIHNVVHNVEEHVHMPHVHVPEVHVPGSGIGGMFQSKKKDHKDKDKDKDRDKSGRSPMAKSEDDSIHLTPSQRRKGSLFKAKSKADALHTLARQDAVFSVENLRRVFRMFDVVRAWVRVESGRVGSGLSMGSAAQLLAGRWLVRLRHHHQHRNASRQW